MEITHKDVSIRQALINSKDIASFKALVDHEKISSLLLLSDAALKQYFDRKVRKYVVDIKHGNFDEVKSTIHEVFKAFDGDDAETWRTVVKRPLEANWAVAFYMLENLKPLGEAIRAKSLVYKDISFYEESKSYGYILNYEVDGYFKAETKDGAINESLTLSNSDYVYYRWSWGYDRFLRKAANFVYSSPKNKVVKVDLKEAFPRLNKIPEVLPEEVRKLFKINKHKGIPGVAYGNTIESYYLANYLLVDFKYEFGKLLDTKIRKTMKLHSISTYVDDNAIFISGVEISNNELDKLVREVSESFNQSSDIFKLNVEKQSVYDEDNIDEFLANRTTYGINSFVSEIEVIQDDLTERDQQYEDIRKTGKEISNALVGDMLNPRDFNYSNKIDEIGNKIYAGLGNKRIHLLFKYLFSDDSLSGFLEDIFNVVLHRTPNYGVRRNRYFIHLINIMLKVNPSQKSLRIHGSIINGLWAGSGISRCSDLDLSVIEYKDTPKISFPGNIDQFFKLFIINAFSDKKRTIEQVFSAGNPDEEEVKKIVEMILEEKTETSIIALANFAQNVFSKKITFFEMKKNMQKIFMTLVSKNNGFFIRRFELALQTSQNRFDLVKNIAILYSNTDRLWTSDDKKLSPQFFLSWSEKDEDYLNNIRSLMKRSLFSMPSAKKSTYLFKRLDILLILRKYIDSLWKNGSRELEHFSNHGTSHSDSLTKYFDDLSSQLDLKPSEYFPVLASILIHDIGLLDDDQVKTDIEFINVINSIAPVLMGTPFNELVKKYFSLRDGMSRAVRNQHGLRSKLIADQLSKEFKFDGRVVHAKNMDFITNAAAIHNGDASVDAMAWSRTEKPLFILSLLDLLDISFERIGRPLLNIGTTTASPITKTFWLKDLLVDYKKLVLDAKTKVLSVDVYFDKIIISEIAGIIQINNSQLAIYTKQQISDQIIDYLFQTERHWLSDSWRKSKRYWTFSDKLGFKVDFKLFPIRSKRDLNYKDLSFKTGISSIEWLEQIADADIMIKYIIDNIKV